MHRISLVEFVIMLAWFLLLGFLVRFLSVSLIARDPNSKVGQALAFMI